MRDIRKNPTRSAVKIAEDISKISGSTVSDSTIRRALHESGLHGRSPGKQPFTSAINKKGRLEYAKKYKNKDVSFWNNVIFSDESKFELFGQKNP